MKTKKRKKPSSNAHNKMLKSWMKDSVFKAEYDALEEEYELLREMLLARKRSGLTQAAVAKRMGTKAPAIARLEAVVAKEKHSPSINTLRKYAHAVGCQLIIHLKPINK